MIKFNKKVIIISVIFILFMTYAISGRIIQSYNINSEKINEINNGFKIKMAYGYFPNYVHIDASDNDNWSNTVSTFDWCNEKDGIYYIENCSIDASLSNTGSGILIENSKSVKFIIQNCSIYNAGSNSLDAGIKLENTCNGTLINNDCSNNNFGGIILNNGCKNNTLSWNVIDNNNAVGIDCVNHCNNNTFEFNFIRENGYVGIVLEDNCNNNTIFSNIAKDNGDIGGIYLENDCNNNIISNNTVGNDLTTNQNFGIYLYMSCDKNLILNNTASNNYWYGISFEGECDNNILIGNTANNNSRYGIYIEDWCDYNNISHSELQDNKIGVMLETGCNNNTFFNNRIINNSQFGVVIENYTVECNYNFFYRNIFNNPLGVNALDNCSNNRWDNGIIGNLWYDYDGKDENDDGIGDIPYNGIGGTGGAQDRFPIWDDGIEINPFPIELFILISAGIIIGATVLSIGFIFWKRSIKKR
ncbi:MAG: nitrous oxide reductase family maturation protein NosD [Promethearchaeota archaeon]